MIYCSTDMFKFLSACKVSNATSESIIHPMVWEMEITEKQKRKERKRRRRIENGKKVKEKVKTVDDWTHGCEAPVFLLSRQRLATDQVFRATCIIFLFLFRNITQDNRNFETLFSIKKSNFF